MPAFHLRADSRHILLLPLRTGLLRSCRTGWALPLTPSFSQNRGISFFCSACLFTNHLSLCPENARPPRTSPSVLQAPPPSPPPLAGRPCLSPTQRLWWWLPGRQLVGVSVPRVSTKNATTPSLLCVGFFQLSEDSGGPNRGAAPSNSSFTLSLCLSLSLPTPLPRSFLQKSKTNPHHPRLSFYFRQEWHFLKGKSKLSLGGGLASVANRIFLPYCDTYNPHTRRAFAHICSWITKECSGSQNGFMVLSFKLGFYKDGKGTDRGFGSFSSLRLSWKLTDVEMECPLPFQRNNTCCPPASHQPQQLPSDGVPWGELRKEKARKHSGLWTLALNH